MKEAKEQKMEKILGDSKVSFTVEHNMWEKEKDLENIKKMIAKFEKKINTELRR